MIRRALFVGAFAAGVHVGCSPGDYQLERRGGPFPTTPVVDEPVSGQGGTSTSGGNPATEGGTPDAASGAGGAAEPAPTLTPFCDALTVVRAKCQRCHTDPTQNGAPVPFDTYEDFQAVYFEPKLWWQRAQEMVEIDYMPYVDLNDPPTSLMPPVEPLTPEEKTTLMSWFMQGALPEGGTDCP